MGGRIAEELLLGPEKVPAYLGALPTRRTLIACALQVSTGASGDLETATRVATDMVTRYGMSPKIGLVSVGALCARVPCAADPGRAALARTGARGEVSGDVQKMVDEEVRRLTQESYERAKKVLTENRRKLDLLAQALLE
jgi:cell division protease FtsH